MKITEIDPIQIVFALSLILLCAFDILPWWVFPYYCLSNIKLRIPIA